MPALSKHAKLQPSSSKRSKKESAEGNKAFKEEGLKYSTQADGAKQIFDLRSLKQISYPELCSWPPQKCWKFLMEHNVLSDDIPLCYSCLEPMTKVNRDINGDFKCQTKGCYIHPLMTCPREAFTPLHSQARQCLASHIRQSVSFF